MPELRVDPATGRQVLIAEDRVRRPHIIGPPSTNQSDADPRDCPFCAGHETETPPAVWEVVDDRDQWQVRVVPNLYPAIVPPVGRHEVVIESPDHFAAAAALDALQWQRILLAYRDRLRFHLATEDVAHAALFKNSGVAAGASLEHVHSQILCLPQLPPMVAQQLEHAEHLYRQRQKCLFCTQIEAELHRGERTLVAGEHVCAFTAVAGRQPYESWIVPRRHVARYDLADEATIAELADVLRDVLGRLDRVASGAAYNLILCSAPSDPRWQAAYHWHWQLIPRMARAAGLEIGAGVYINTLAPETAAEHLRRAAPGS